MQFIISVITITIIQSNLIFETKLSKSVPLSVIISVGDRREDLGEKYFCQKYIQKKYFH